MKVKYNTQGYEKMTYERGVVWGW